jgi:hypothetical protein
MPGASEAEIKRFRTQRAQAMELQLLRTAETGEPLALLPRETPETRRSAPGARVQRRHSAWATFEARADQVHGFSVQLANAGFRHP